MAADRCADLLAAAQAALDGDLALPTGRATRAAALLARTALETTVEDHLLDAGWVIREATGRVRLICLRAIAGEELGGEAAWAWAALSQACHHHAYELTPTTGEVSHLLGVVVDLRRRLAAAPPHSAPTLRVT